MMVYRDDGSKNYNHRDVFEKWKSDFCTMLNRPPDESEEFDNVFYQETVRKLLVEETLPNADLNQDQGINNGISIQEVKSVIRKLKCGKSTGPDFLPNEILKKPQLTKLLHILE